MRQYYGAADERDISDFKGKEGGETGRRESDKKSTGRYLSKEEGYKTGSK